MDSTRELQRQLILTYSDIILGIANNEFQLPHIDLVESLHAQTQVKKQFADFIQNPSAQSFKNFWKREYIFSAQQSANATNILTRKGLPTVLVVMQEINLASEYHDGWEPQLGARNSLRELWSKLKDEPLQNGCSDYGLRFFGFPQTSTYSEFKKTFQEFATYYQSIIKKTQSSHYSIHIEIDRLFNYLDKASYKELEQNHEYQSGQITRLFELKKQIEMIEFIESKIIQKKIKEYCIARQSHDPEKYDEEYKWEKLPNIQTELTSVSTINDISSTLKKENTNWVHFVQFQNLNRFVNQFPQEANAAFDKLKDNAEPLHQRINNCIEISTIGGTQTKLSTHLAAYYMAATNPGKYPLFKDEIFTYAKNLFLRSKAWETESAGMKYQLYTDLCTLVGEHLKTQGSLTNAKFPIGITALDGQDFLYWIARYNRDQEKTFTQYLHNFINQADTESQTTNYYPNYFKDCSVRVSFGQGGKAEIPWITFLLGENTPAKGFFPGYLYYKEINKLVLEYGVSAENTPPTTWRFTQHPPTVEEYFRQQFQYVPSKYGNSYIFKIYDTTELESISEEVLEADLDTIISQYKKQITEQVPQEETTMNQTKLTLPKNLILYGPPGTGKTYQAVSRALQLIKNEPDYTINKSREEITAEFKNLKDNKQVEFVTFHQSYAYEEFIEGIRPTLDTDQVKYELHKGVFKEIADTARSYTEKPQNTFKGDLNNVNFFKMSLGNTLNTNDEDVYEYCIKNNCIAIGYGNDLDYTQFAKMLKPDISFNEFKNKLKFFLKELAENLQTFDYQALYCFLIWMNKGDLVLISKGNGTLRAIGRITNEYTYSLNNEIRYTQYRNVEWLATNLEIPVEQVYDRKFSQMSIYHLEKNSLKIPAIQSLIAPPTQSPPPNYVLIIDEINRGNISKIFGELITLLEEDKRLGQENELTTVLPYSKTQFGVPSNLYVIGTMNTTDRSIALLDTALRRRFTFEEVLPEYESTGLNTTIIDELNLGLLLKNLNQAICILKDKDHQIGHSYFIKIQKSSDQLMTLHSVWYHEIVPLLQEYFYNSPDHLALLLGQYNEQDKTGFIEIISSELSKKFAASDFDEDSVKITTIHNYPPQELIEALYALTN